MNMTLDETKKYSGSSHLSKYDLVYKVPSRCWQDGLTIGNGDLAAIVWENGSSQLEYQVNHARIWDKRLVKYNRFRMDHIRKIAEEGLSFKNEMLKEWDPSSPPFADVQTPCSGGQLRIVPGIVQQFAPGYRITKKLSLKDAVIETNLDKHLSHPRIRSFVCSHENILAISVRDVSLMTAFQNRIELFCYPEKDYEPAELHAEGSVMYFFRRLPTISYIMAVKAVPRGGGKNREYFEKIVHPDNHKYGIPSTEVNASCAKNHAFASLTGDFDLFVTIEAGSDLQELKETALKRLESAAAAGIEELYREHCKYWNDFWTKNKVSLGNEFLEQLWYLSNYHLRCGMGGSIPWGLCGPWFGNHQSNRSFLPWNGFFTNDYNAQCVPLAADRVNRGDLAVPTFEMLKRQLAEAQKNAELYDQKGALYPLSCGPSGVDVSGGAYRFCQGSGVYWCLVMDHHYQRSGDEKFFSEIFYPILRECLIFFSGYMIYDEQEDRYHLKYSQNPELGYIHLQDPIDTLVFLKYALTVAVASSGKVKEDPENLEKWRHILARFPKYPHYDNGFLPLDGLRWDHINHSRTLACVFPAGEVDPLKTDDPLLPIALKELHSNIWDCFMRSYACADGYHESWTGKVYHKALPACRLGDKEMAWKYLSDMISGDVKPNGLITHNPAILAASRESEKNIDIIPDMQVYHDCGPEPITLAELAAGRVWEECTEDLECRERMYPVIEGPAVYLLLISEMLMQSYNGIIRLFPAWNDRLDASFEGLSAEGGITVSASCKAGEVRWIKLSADKAVDFKLLNPWKDRTPEITPAMPLTIDSLIQGHLEAGMSIVLRVDGAEQPEFSAVEENAPAVRTIRFENGGGAILGKPEYSDYYRFLEELRGTTGDEIRL
ncbi:MAG: hypothetical protein IJW23_00115 [Lentisphaeria bacterium]|nr:hypothetical protein [Lentisphaeria bacterium]